MEGDFNQDLYSLGLEAAWQLELAEFTRLTPFASVRQTWIEQDGYTESGGGAWFAHRLGDLDGESFVSVLGVRLAHDWFPAEDVVLTPAVSIGWQHEFGDRQFDLRTGLTAIEQYGIIYQVKSVQQDRDAALVGLSLDVMRRTESGSLFGAKFAWNMDWRDNSLDNNFFAGVEFRF